MKEQPILFSGPMVRAILSGEKTQTRRVVKPQETCIYSASSGTCSRNVSGFNIRCCPFQEGMTLWVREAWAHETEFGTFTGCALYRADGDTREIQSGKPTDIWHPSIHMPRWASRITLEITAVRVERLQDITEEDARAEGIHEFDIGVNGKVYGTNPCAGNDVGATATEAFAILWDSINAKRGHPWDSNPWVWALEFKHVEVDKL